MFDWPVCFVFIVMVLKLIVVFSTNMCLSLFLLFHVEEKEGKHTMGEEGEGRENEQEEVGECWGGGVKGKDQQEVSFNDREII